METLPILGPFTPKALGSPRRPRSARRLLPALAIAVALAGCGTSGSSNYSIGGSVSGLADGAQITLQDNGTDSLTVSANGPFTFASPIPLNGSYAVTVANQPAGQTCSVAQASGAGVVANISTVAVTCSTSGFTLSGQVAGLTSNQQVTLLNNGADPVTVSANGNFAFATPIAQGGNYSVTVGTQPTQQTCSVSAGSGSAVAADISNVAVNCSGVTYTVGGALTGMANNTQITLKNNGADPLTLTADGNFTFATPVVSGSPYAVTVGTQPSGQYCTLTNDSGSVTANVVNVGVACSPSSWTALGSGFNGPGGVAVDAIGNVFVTEYFTGEIKKIAADGVTVTTVATGFSYPFGLAIDPAGNIYVAEPGSAQVKKIDANGGPTTTIGSGFNTPLGVTLDAAGNLYVADTGNSLIKKIAASGGAVSILGSGFNTPYGVAVDSAGNVFVADTGNNLVKKIAASDGAVTTLGSGITSAYSVAVDAAGNVYVADGDAGVVRMIAASDGATTSIGGAFSFPTGVAVDTAGRPYVADMNGPAVKVFR